MKFAEIKNFIRRGRSECIGSYKSWQSVIKTKKEIFGESKVINVNFSERREWRSINNLGAKSIENQEKLEEMEEDFK